MNRQQNLVKCASLISELLDGLNRETITCEHCGLIHYKHKADFHISNTLTGMMNKLKRMAASDWAKETTPDNEEPE